MHGHHMLDLMPIDLHWLTLSLTSVGAVRNYPSALVASHGTKA